MIADSIVSRTAGAATYRVSETRPAGLASDQSARPIADVVHADHRQSARPVSRLSAEAISAIGASDQSAETSKKSGELSEEEQKVVNELKKTDREVRAHEQAHKAAGGPYASAPSYEYQVGPDQQRYAVSGEVKIDSAPIPGDPEATISKLEIVIRAALAPAEPSAQDYKVAATARQNIQQAQADLQAQKTEERKELLENEDEDTGQTGNTDIKKDDQVATLVSVAIA